MIKQWMKTNRKRVFAALATLWVTSPVWGDDTEIFFGNFDGGNFLPNVLFVMDTSGSMGGRPNNETNLAKIEIVKRALKQLAVEMNGVNVGLMRFSTPGGPVMYPVTFIDKEIPPFGEGSQTVVYPIASSGLDATESVSSGAVSLNRAELLAGEGVNQTTTQFRVLWGGDDADEGGATGNRLDTNSSDERLGIRFQSTDTLPAAAVVTDARLSVTADGNANNTGTTVFSVRGDLPPAGNFQSSSSGSLASRSDLTTASVLWKMNSASGNPPSAGETLVSPNIAAVFNEITADPDWDTCGICDDTTLILDRVAAESSSGDRRGLFPYERQTDASKLFVTYAVNGGAVEKFVSGVQFPEVSVPRNAVITEATLELTPMNTTSMPIDLEIGLEDAATPAAFATVPNSLSDRFAAASTASVSVPSWAVGNRVALDVTGLIGSKTGSNNWCSGNPMSLLVAASSAPEQLRFHSFDGDPSLAPVLRITYDADSIVPGNTCVQGLHSVRVGRSSDDVRANNSSGTSVSTSGSTITVNSGRPWAALRFANYPLAAGAKISSAHLYLTARNGNSGTVQIQIEDVADSAPLNTGVSSRDWQGGVSWSVSGWRDRTEYRSPDIKDLLQRALDAGFDVGNAISLRVLRSSGSISFSSYDRNPIWAARLEVNYESDGTGTVGTARTEFINAVDSLTAEGFTPIQDTMFEAYNYYAGEPVVWGKYRGGHDEAGNRINVPNGSDPEPFFYTRVSAKDAITADSWGGVVRPPGCNDRNLSSPACDDPNGSGQPEGEYLAGTPVYKSPIDNQCQFESHIVFLTDGAANVPNSENLIKQSIGVGSCPSSNNRSQACVVELADHMFTNDMSSSLEGNQRVVTHMIGFDYDEPWLQNIASAGGGIYETADSLDSLLAQFKEIIAEVMKTDTSFVAPVAAINQFNRLTNLDSVYFAVFKPDAVPAWVGNLKRYQLGQSGVETNVLLDANGQRALNPDTGFFSGTAQSFWSSSPDGTTVDAGGAGEMVPSYSSRRIYTDTQAAPTTLSNSANKLSSTNSSVTAAMLDVAPGDRAKLLDWITGKDTEDADDDGTTSEDRYVIQDPLHSRPVAVTYGSLGDIDGDGQPDPDVTIFFGTNGGSLHAIDATTGKELFSYIPREMLDLQKDLRANDGGSAHYYGLDGSASVWVRNTGTDQVSSSEGDHVYLYIGQRRGGRNYYALDLTNRAAPKLMWKIKGGEGDFGNLGQSWARPIPGRLTIDGAARDVLYISGGYDPVNDVETTRNSTPDAMGNAIYIVDALTGQKIWSAGSSAGHDLVLPQMIHAIPATASVYDVNSDGSDDGLFIGDVGGQLWRFDFIQGQPPATLVRGGVIAQLATGGNSFASQNRRFFHSPDVALIDINETRKLAVTIGSGSRPSPLSEQVDDRFYAVFQDSVFGPPAQYDTLYEGDDPDTGPTETSAFYDATANLIQTGTAAEVGVERDRLAAASGWFIDLTRSGEKVLSTPLAARDSVIFATYEPTNDAASCTPKAGTSRAYVVSLADATATIDVIGDQTPAPPSPTSSRDTILSTSSIVDEPVIICTEDGCDVFVGPEQFELPVGQQINRTYWRQDQ